MENKVYGLESKTTFYGTEYRWYSKYNGARGPWTHDKKEAIDGGKSHQTIIECYHGNQ